MLGPYYITTDSRRRAAWGAPCGNKATAGRVVIDGRSFVLHDKAVEAFEAWEYVRDWHNYKLTGSDTGFYNCRHTQHDPSLPMSYHSWGMALDVNWLENPAGNKLVTDIPQEMIENLLAIRTNSGARVFRWGGDWDWDGEWKDHSYVDAMHWEVVAHPIDLATGIDWSTVIGGEMIRRDAKADDGLDIHKSAVQDMTAAGVMTSDTQPGGVAFNDETATFLVRYREKVVKPEVRKAIAKATAGGASAGAVISEIIRRLGEG